MAKRYRIREERSGAMLFDMVKGTVEEMSESEYQSIMEGKKVRFGYLFDSDGNRLFSVFKPKVKREDLPSDCLSAPSKVYFEITRKCNLKCSYCYNRSELGFDKQLDKSTIFSLLRELSSIGTFEIRFTGGEPTTHPDFFEIVNYAKKMGFYVSIGTNLSFSKETLQKLKRSGVDMVITSIDGPEEYNDSMRGKGVFSKVISNIKGLKKAGNIAMKMNSVLCKRNKDHVGYLIDLADELGIAAVNFSPIKNNGRASEDHDCVNGAAKESIALDAKDMMDIVSMISEKRKGCKAKINTYLDIIDHPTSEIRLKGSLINRMSCAAGIEVAAISPFGEVYGCVVSPANDLKQSKAKRIFTAGNLKKDSFTRIWLDSKRWEIFRNIRSGKSSKCVSCKHYTKKCFGNCPVESFLTSGKVNSPNRLCFADLIKGEAL